MSDVEYEVKFQVQYPVTSRVFAATEEDAVALAERLLPPYESVTLVYAVRTADYEAVVAQRDEAVAALTEWQTTGVAPVGLDVLLGGVADTVVPE